MAVVDEIPGEATFTRKVTAQRSEVLATAEDEARRAGTLLAEWPGGIPAGGPGFLFLPVDDGDPVEIEVGVPAEYTPGGVHPDLTAGFRPCGMVVRFHENEPAEQWLADNGYDRAGRPWVTFPDREIVCPVRPVRDTDTFVGRHGPRNDLERGREELESSTTQVSRVLGRLRDGSATSVRTLAGLHEEAMDAARYQHLVAPGTPEVGRYLALAARAEIADKVRRTSKELTVDLDGPVSLTTGEGVEIDNRFIDAVMLAVALKDEVALDLVREFALEEHLKVHQKRPTDFVLLQAQAMVAVARDEPDAKEKLALVLVYAESAARSNQVGPWYAHTQVPVWRLALGQAGARDALVAHRTWWGTCQPNPGDRQDRSPKGYMSVGVLCFGDGTVRSEYLPEL
ncbi:hypothetical protein [Actinocrispum wychmicini]|uniref:Uncharacterized protein n=1 Tax=Actinocrispum wychmicini TaxID=1213861 RepID=A0A4R2JDE9_9PSEU|nr:hypothetical protein [Actinocrispum wychmicini]TCO54209.1 hypothetical protein EV192_109189 [Actinocrispum wychmicini]